MKALRLFIPPLIAVLAISVVGFAQSQDKPKLYIEPSSDGFNGYLTAAMIKKQVPVTLLDKPEGTEYRLKSVPVEVKKETTGSKVTRCIFISCAGIEDRASVSVELLKGETVVWSYAVNKGRGHKNMQSMAEAVAKHLKGDYFKK